MGTGKRAGAILVVLAFVLAACGSDSETEPAASDESPDTEQTEQTESPSPTDGAQASGPQFGEDGKLLPLDDGFPEREITLWSVFEAGHADDLFNKAVADVASKYSPVPVTSDVNPMGPDIQFGMASDFLPQQPGGEEGYHTFTASWHGPAVRLMTRENLTKFSLDDVRPINAIDFSPVVLVVRSDLEFETLEELEQHAKENPNDLTLVASGSGSGLHITSLLWQDQAGVEVEFLPTDGAGESQQTLLGGGADVGVLNAELAKEQPDLRPLLVSGDTAVEEFPDVPTAADVGYTLPAATYRGLGTLPSVPDSHYEWLEALFKKVAEDPDFQEQRPIPSVYRSGKEVKQLLQSIQDSYKPILSDLGLLVEEGE